MAHSHAYMRTWTPHHKKYTLTRGSRDTCPALQGSPITSPHTCSLVVRPLATSTTWNPVRPATGMKNKPATHITAILKPDNQGEQSNVISPSPARAVAIFPLTLTATGLNFLHSSPSHSCNPQALKDTWQPCGPLRVPPRGRGHKGGQSQTRP